MYPISSFNDSPLWWLVAVQGEEGERGVVEDFGPSSDFDFSCASIVGVGGIKFW